MLPEKPALLIYSSFLTSISLSQLKNQRSRPMKTNCSGSVPSSLKTMWVVRSSVVSALPVWEA